MIDNISLIDRLTQAGDSEAGAAFNEFMHTIARTAFVTVMFEEVETLCGKAYHPLEGSDLQRAGSAPGRYFFGTEEFAIQRPGLSGGKASTMAPISRSTPFAHIFKTSSRQARPVRMKGINTRPTGYTVEEKARPKGDMFNGKTRGFASSSTI